MVVALDAVGVRRQRFAFTTTAHGPSVRQTLRGSSLWVSLFDINPSASSSIYVGRKVGTMSGREHEESDDAPSQSLSHSEEQRVLHAALDSFR